MKPVFSYVVFGLLLLLAACTKRPSSCMLFPQGGSYCLQSTREVPAFELQQQIDFSLKGQQEMMISQVEVDEEGMCMVGLTPFGQKLLQLRFDNESVKADLWPIRRLKPAFLLGMVQLSTWPAQSIQRGLSASLQLEEAAAQRKLTKKGVLVMKVDYTRGLPPEGDMVVEFPELEVKMRISTLENMDDPPLHSP